MTGLDEALRRGLFEDKRERVLRYLAERDYAAAVIGRRDNFAWITSGGDSTVVRTTEIGVGLLVVTSSRTTLVAYTMDAAHLFEDEMAGADVELVAVKWFEGSLTDAAQKACGHGRVLSDIPMDGAVFDPDAIFDLHYPLSREELQLAAEIGAQSERILRANADAVTPGASERSVAHSMGSQYEAAGFGIDVILVGGESRVGIHRHPVPSDSALGATVLLHSAVSKFGLHANVTRMVCLGAPAPAELEEKYSALCEMEVATVAMCEPGTEFSAIYAERKAMYRKAGYEEEWMYHFGGGPTGYVLARGNICAGDDAVVSDRQPYDWFITISGAKVEELAILDGESRTIASAGGAWPTRAVTSHGLSLGVPWILER